MMLQFIKDPLELTNRRFSFTKEDCQRLAFFSTFARKAHSIPFETHSDCSELSLTGLLRDERDGGTV